MSLTIGNLAPSVDPSQLGTLETQLRVFDEIAVEIADRLEYPKKGMIYGKSGPSAAACRNSLRPLGFAVVYRNKFFMDGAVSGFTDRIYSSADEKEDKLEKSKLLKNTTIILKLMRDIITATGPIKLPVDVQHTNQKSIKEFCEYAHEALRILTEDVCSKDNPRIDNVSKNTTSGGAGTLKVEAFKLFCRLYIKQYTERMARLEARLASVGTGVPRGGTRKQKARKTRNRKAHGRKTRSRK